MPPQAKVTRQMILDAAFALAREEGHGAITARRLAAKLNCSTQPILYQFDSVEQIMEETYRRADAYHTAWLLEGLEKEEEPLLALGLRYIRFGAEEKRLFCFLFQSGRFSGRSLESLFRDPGTAPLMELIRQSEGAPPEEAARMFPALFAAAHGYASLLANNAMAWSEQAATEMLLTLHGMLTQERK